jgi:hypothetical protein
MHYVLAILALLAIAGTFPFCDWYDKRRTRRQEEEKQFGHIDTDAMWPR